MKLSPPNSANSHKEDDTTWHARIPRSRPARQHWRRSGRSTSGPALALPPALAIPSIHRALSARLTWGTRRRSPKHSSNGNRPRNGSRATQSSCGAGRAQPGPVERSSTGSPDQHLRTYSIPDYRLEHPDFTVRQAIEKDKDGAEHVRYEVEGNLDAPVPPIRDSKYLDQAASHRDLPLHAAQPQNGSRARKSLQARQSRRRSLFRTRPGSLLLRLRLRARQRRLVRPHDPQPGIAAGPRLRAPATP